MNELKYDEQSYVLFNEYLIFRQANVPTNSSEKKEKKKEEKHKATVQSKEEAIVEVLHREEEALTEKRTLSKTKNS